MFRVSRYCLLESLAHANIASVPEGEMTVWERRQSKSGVSWQPLHQAEVQAWEAFEAGGRAA